MSLKDDPALTDESTRQKKAKVSAKEIALKGRGVVCPANLPPAVPASFLGALAYIPAALSPEPAP